MKKLLLILDINNTLADKIREETNGVIRTRWKLYDNLKELFSLNKKFNIKIVIWSSAFKRNILLFMKVAKISCDIMDREDCEKDFDSANEWDTIKPLRKAWQKYPEYDNTNTIIVDDTPSKIIENKENHYNNTSKNLKILIEIIIEYFNTDLNVSQFLSCK